MRKNMEYHQLTFTLDKQVRGKYEMPHTVCIESKNFTEYILERNRNISMYFENKKDLYERMPDHLHGKLLKRKNAIDFMDFAPSCLSLVAVISDRIKKIFNQLNVSTEEYVLKNISIKGCTENFHLLFIPIIRDTDFIYPKSVFVDMFNDKITKVFSNRTEYYNDPESYYLKKVTLKSMYKGFDLLYPQHTW